MYADDNGDRLGTQRDGRPAGVGGGLAADAPGRDQRPPVDGAQGAALDYNQALGIYKCPRTEAPP